MTQHEVLAVLLLGPQSSFIILGELFEGVAHSVVGQEAREAPAPFNLFK